MKGGSVIVSKRYSASSKVNDAATRSEEVLNAEAARAQAIRDSMKATAILEEATTLAAQLNEKFRAADAERLEALKRATVAQENVRLADEALATAAQSETAVDASEEKALRSANEDYAVKRSRK
jgi:ABC-type antimicrobial peptide transport system ATPase subunit